MTVQNSKLNTAQNYAIVVILFLLPAYLSKIKFNGISFNALELLIGISFLLWIYNKNTKYQIPNTKYILPAGLIITGLTLSALVNKNYYAGFGAIKGWFLFPIIFGIIFFDSLQKDESLLKKSLLALLFSGAAVSAIGIIYEFLGNVTYDNRLKIFWDSPNQLAMFLAVPFLIGLFLALREKGSKKRPYILSAALIGMGLYYTFSYGAWLAIAAAILAFFWLAYRNKFQKKHVLILFIIVILLGWGSLKKYQSIARLGERSSLASREMIWQSAGLMIEKNPIFGIGPGNFQAKYLEYQKYFPSYLEWSAPQPHNLFLAFWLESGLVGLAGFVLLLFYFFHDNKKVYPFTKINEYNNASISEIKKQTGEGLANKENFGGGVIRDFRILLFSIMIYTLIHGLVDTTYWRNDLAVVFWVVVAMNLSLSKKKLN